MNLRCDHCTDDTHDSVQRNSNAVSGASVSGGQHFGGVGIERGIVDILQIVSCGPRTIQYQEEYVPSKS